MATGTEVFPFQTTIPVRKLKKPSLFGCCVTPQDASQADANFSVKSVEQGKGCRLAIGAEALIYMPKEKAASLFIPLDDVSGAVAEALTIDGKNVSKVIISFHDNARDPLHVLALEDASYFCATLKRRLASTSRLPTTAQSPILPIHHPSSLAGTDPEDAVASGTLAHPHASSSVAVRAHPPGSANPISSLTQSSAFASHQLLLSSGSSISPVPSTSTVGDLGHMGHSRTASTAHRPRTQFLNASPPMVPSDSLPMSPPRSGAYSAFTPSHAGPSPVSLSTMLPQSSPPKVDLLPQSVSEITPQPPTASSPSQAGFNPAYGMPSPGGAPSPRSQARALVLAQQAQLQVATPTALQAQAQLQLNLDVASHAVAASDEAEAKAKAALLAGIQDVSVRSIDISLHAEMQLPGALPLLSPTAAEAHALTTSPGTSHPADSMGPAPAPMMLDSLSQLSCGIDPSASTIAALQLQERRSMEGPTPSQGGVGRSISNEPEEADTLDRQVSSLHTTLSRASSLSVYTDARSRNTSMPGLLVSGTVSGSGSGTASAYVSFGGAPLSNATTSSEAPRTSAAPDSGWQAAVTDAGAAGHPPGSVLRSSEQAVPGSEIAIEDSRKDADIGTAGEVDVLSSEQPSSARRNLYVDAAAFATSSLAAVAASAAAALTTASTAGTAAAGASAAVAATATAGATAAMGATAAGVGLGAAVAANTAAVASAAVSASAAAGAATAAAGGASAAGVSMGAGAAAAAVASSPVALAAMTGAAFAVLAIGAMQLSKGSLSRSVHSTPSKTPIQTVLTTTARSPLAEATMPANLAGAFEAAAVEEEVLHAPVLGLKAGMHQPQMLVEQEHVTSNDDREESCAPPVSISRGVEMSSALTVAGDMQLQAQREHAAAEPDCSEAGLVTIPRFAASITHDSPTLGYGETASAYERGTGAIPLAVQSLHLAPSSTFLLYGSDAKGIPHDTNAGELHADRFQDKKAGAAASLVGAYAGAMETPITAGISNASAPTSAQVGPPGKSASALAVGGRDAAVTPAMLQQPASVTAGTGSASNSSCLAALVPWLPVDATSSGSNVDEYILPAQRGRCMQQQTGKAAAAAAESTSPGVLHAAATHVHKEHPFMHADASQHAAEHAPLLDTHSTAAFASAADETGRQSGPYDVVDHGGSATHWLATDKCSEPSQVCMLDQLEQLAAEHLCTAHLHIMPAHIGMGLARISMDSAVSVESVGPLASTTAFLPIGTPPWETGDLAEAKEESKGCAAEQSLGVDAQGTDAVSQCEPAMLFHQQQQEEQCSAHQLVATAMPQLASEPADAAATSSTWPQPMTAAAAPARRGAFGSISLVPGPESPLQCGTSTITSAPTPQRELPGSEKSIEGSLSLSATPGSAVEHTPIKEPAGAVHDGGDDDKQRGNGEDEGNDASAWEALLTSATRLLHKLSPSPSRSTSPLRHQSTPSAVPWPGLDTLRSPRQQPPSNLSTQGGSMQVHAHGSSPASINGSVGTTDLTRPSTPSSIGYGSSYQGVNAYHDVHGMGMMQQLRAGTQLPQHMMGMAVSSPAMVLNPAFGSENGSGPSVHTGAYAGVYGGAGAAASISSQAVRSVAGSGKHASEQPQSPASSRLMHEVMAAWPEADMQQHEPSTQGRYRGGPWQPSPPPLGMGLPNQYGVAYHGPGFVGHIRNGASDASVAASWTQPRDGTQPLSASLPRDYGQVGRSLGPLQGAMAGARVQRPMDVAQPQFQHTAQRWQESDSLAHGSLQPYADDAQQRQRQLASSPGVNVYGHARFVTDGGIGSGWHHQSPETTPPKIQGQQQAQMFFFSPYTTNPMYSTNPLYLPVSGERECSVGLQTSPPTQEGKGNSGSRMHTAGSAASHSASPLVGSMMHGHGSQPALNNGKADADVNSGEENPWVRKVLQQQWQQQQQRPREVAWLPAIESGAPAPTPAGPAFMQPPMHVHDSMHLLEDVHGDGHVPDQRQMQQYLHGSPPPMADQMSRQHLGLPENTNSALQTSISPPGSEAAAPSLAWQIKAGMLGDDDAASALLHAAWSSVGAAREAVRTGDRAWARQIAATLAEVESAVDALAAFR